MNEQTTVRWPWLGLAVLTLPTLLLSIDLSILHLALPHIAAALGPSSTEQLWIMDSYGFLMAGFLITMGTLGDRIGRRRLLMVGAVLFAAASTAAAFAADPLQLVATRALMGVAGAMVMPSTLALVIGLFPDQRRRSTAIAVFISCFMAGTAIGPLVGGAMLGAFWWGSVFLLGVPVMAALLAIGPFLLPEFRSPRAGRIDLTSVALSLATVLPVVWGVKELAAQGPAPLAVAALVIGLAAGAVFVRRQRVLPDPLLDVRLFADRAFGSALAVLLVATATMGGVGLLVNQYLQLVLGLSALAAGLWLVPPAVASVVGAMLAPRVAGRTGPARAAAIGLAVSAVGLVLISRAADTSTPLPVVIGFTLLFLGFGTVATLGNDLIVNAAPPERAGSAASIVSVCSEFGIAMGVALLGSVGTIVYRSELHPPTAVPADAAAAAQDTLAGATVAAGGLPPVPGDALLVAARAAFVDGLGLVAGITAAALVVAGALAAVVLRDVRVAAPPAPEEPVPAERAD